MTNTSFDDIEQIVKWVSDRIFLPNYTPELWDPEHSAIVKQFASTVQASTLIIMIQDKQLLMQNTPSAFGPALSNEKMLYFVKNAGMVLSMTNINLCVQYGTLSGDSTERLLQIMNGIYLPRLENVTSWPESLQKEFSGQYYRFMSCLTETVNHAHGKTVLYLPPNTTGNAMLNPKDKDLVQQLESTVIHWTRQIKEVVNNQDNVNDPEGAGPLEEIKFWEHRTRDLSGITEQLNRSDVREIVELLRTVKSSYLQPFETLSNIITQGSEEANDNLRFLNKLSPICIAMSTAEPKDIPSKLPKVLNFIRLIWMYSQFYHTEDRITSLLRKVSNEIISCCCKTISLDEIFNGDIEGSIQKLEESIACGVAWKKIYFATAEAVKASKQKNRQLREWNFDDTSIFAQVDAFVQRCRDLLEVCEGQIQFARKSQNEGKGSLPCFGGNRGQEIVKSLLGIELQFEAHVDKLRRLEYDILDVKITHWHGDFNSFKNGVKDLEAMTQNVINAAFDAVSTISAGVDLLQAFQTIAKREAIKRCLQKRMIDIFSMFKSNVASARSIFEKLKSNPPLSATEPQFAGAALWARSLLLQNAQDLERLNTLTCTQGNEKQDASAAFEGIKAVFQDFIMKKYNDWIEDLNKLGSSNLSTRLEKPLMVKASQVQAGAGGSSRKIKKGFLECNFDRPLLQLFSEVHYWQFFNGEVQIPYIAHDINNQKEQLRILREHVMLVVRDYNQILKELSATERRLFEDIIRRLDRRIQPGLQKLTWVSKGIVDWYVADCRKHCVETFSIVQEFQANKDVIAKNCRLISSLVLIDIERNTVYDDGVFEAKQSTHHQLMKAKLQESHRSISSTMGAMYEHFATGTPEVHREWARFVAQADKSLEDALRQSVKRSLQELSKAINGDAKTEPHPLFKIHVILEDNKVEFSPLMIDLTQMVNTVSKEVLRVISVVPKLRSSIAGSQTAPAVAEAGGAEANDAAADNFYQSIVNDEEILKVVVQIMNGMSASAAELQKYLGYWENKYKLIWNQDKQAFIRRYAKANRPVSQFRVDIERYREQQNVIQNEDLTNTINFIQVNTSLLKASLVDHTIQWIGKLTGLLNQTATEELVKLRDTMREHTSKLSIRPASLDHLGESIQLLQSIKENASKMEARFAPLQSKYELLQEFDVQVAEEEQRDLQQLPSSWEAYQAMMVESSTMLQKCKVSMKQNLQDAVTDLNSHMEELRLEAKDTLPYSDETTSSAAHALLLEFEKKMAETRTRQEALRKGLEIFDITENENEGFQATEKDLDLLQQIWGLFDEWEEAWSIWKGKVFRDLNIEDMEQHALDFYKRITKLGRQIKRWKIWESMKAKIEQFRATMPLIQDLKSPALRPRHWAQLKDEMNQQFDAFARSFTLEKVFSLGFHLHAEYISTLSTNANKELAIEEALKNIHERWGTIEIDMADYKNVYHKIRSTDDLFTALEDDQVQLSSIKASPFFSSFESEITYWERALSLVSEVVESLLSVQRCWIYLESIFMTSEDIRKQLPLESKLFDEVNHTYIEITEGIVNDPKALSIALRDGVLRDLNTMQDKLDRIQKCLDQYLETKRMLFPRFYFLSNDDLLEILGHQKDPDQVQKHIKKCFEAIKTLNLLSPGTRGNLTFEAAGMNAPDGEHVPFASNVVVSGAVEGWLCRVEKQMVATLEKCFSLCLLGYRGKKEKWIKDHPGQLLISCGQTAWTGECTRALNDVAKGEKKALRQLKKKWVSYLNKLADMVRGQLSSIDRKKVVALITMEIHSRDVVERMIKQNCKSINDFEWLMQLRLYFNKDLGDCGICEAKQTVTCLQYSYEYQGNNGRLVVTPLTDRCVLTMTTALHLNRGGNPLGPAGTGKTETVKDLGKNLAKYVIVFNCSDGLDYKSVGRMFSGLVQSGGWGCFDEFNRIEIEVLSVVAQQVLTIMQALTQKLTQFSFLGTIIQCNHNMGIFITMNPGYAGRTELPDNLKALMRPCAMMVPDLALIAEVMLQAEGFRDAKILARKTTTLYGLMVQQLSKQDHYDFGLRSLKAVLNMAGSLKRGDATLQEEMILLRALRDMNMPKFIREDAALFRLLLGDLFPSLELPVSEYGVLQEAIVAGLKEDGLQEHPLILFKTIQLYESQVTRHCNMIVGQTMAGKSTTWKLLEKAKGALAKDGIPNYRPVRTQVLNPKSISLNEIYGVYDLSTFEWVDGILSTIFRNFAADEKDDEKWILLDGPVDTLWIESMNSVMDDNKVLTLINGDRISMTPSMALLFEVQDLAVASPATVSRAGMVYMDADDLGWRPFVQSWLDGSITDPEERECLSGLFDKYVVGILKFKSAERIAEPVPVNDTNCVRSLCNLYMAIRSHKANGLASDSPPAEGGESGDGARANLIEKWFLFCCTWSVMGAVGEAGRARLDAFVRDIDTLFPPVQTMFEYTVDQKTREFKQWEEKLSASYRIPPGTPSHKIIVPTVDTLRYGFLIQSLVQYGVHTLIVGDTGVGKTVLVQKESEGFGENFNRLVMNFSSATSSETTQSIIENVMEKRSMNRFGPIGGRKLVTFVDDLNMPSKDLFGSQPPLELLRQWIDYGCWYDRKKQSIRYIIGMQLLAAMGPPGGGRSVITPRLQSRFNLIHMTISNEKQLRRIFETMLVPKLMEFDDEIKPLGGPLVLSTIQLYKTVEDKFLPTPAKCHYLFNLRDMAKVIQGLLIADKKLFTSRDSMLRLWVHECSRVFSDRLICVEDRGVFVAMLEELLGGNFQTDWNRLIGDEFKQSGPMFSSVLDPNQAEGQRSDAYDEISSFGTLKTYLEEQLENYNIQGGLVPMDLVMFRDAMIHLLRIHRVLGAPRGNLMLVGVGGSGRQSLTRLASFLCNYRIFQIEITKNYKLTQFREDLKKMYSYAGCEGVPTTFLFNDTQIKEESFLEDINNLLNSGEVPGLFEKDEIPAILDEVRNRARSAGITETPDSLWSYFISAVRENLHVVLAMSPIGEALRNRCRQFPSLVNCTTIDWYDEWPPDALQEVGLKFLNENQDIDDDELKLKIATVFAVVHTSVITVSKQMIAALKRYNYVTPTNYLALVKGYQVVLREKSRSITDARDKLQNGLAKLDESRIQVEEMSEQLEQRKLVVEQKNKDCSELLVVIVSERRTADEQRKQVEADSQRIGKEEKETQEVAADAQRDLDEALPALEKAMAEVEKLDKNAISEVKAYSNPPAVVSLVLSGVMVLFGLSTDWPTAKKKISETNFLQQIKTFDKDAISNKTITGLRKYTSKPDFNPDIVRNVSTAAGALCCWVKAMEVYSAVLREVEPKRLKLKESQRILSKKQKALAEAKEKLREVTEKVEGLKAQYDNSVNEKNALREEAELLELKLSRAENLVSGLSGERERWLVSISEKQKSLVSVCGDALVGAGFLSYAGPFDSTYRRSLIDTWMNRIQQQQIPLSLDFSFIDFLADPTDVRQWNVQGLPRDSFSAENGVMTTRCTRWPLMIDPQEQANKWIKKMEGDRLEVVDPLMKDFLRKMENGIRFGTPVLMQDILEELDPSLEPVLNKSIIKIGNREVLRLGDKELDYNHDFRFYLTTKLQNPHYTPEVSTKTTIVNFVVKEQGLEAQLLGIVVQMEEPALESQKSDLVVKVAGAKKKLVDLENDILRLLSTAEGSLLDDESLVGTLNAAKVTSEEVSAQLIVSEETEKKIDQARMGYTPVSIRASILYFVLNDMANVDAMYQFSLGAYIDLFQDSIEKSRHAKQQIALSDDLNERIEAVNAFHTYAVYAYACRALFKRHKLLFSFQMCMRVMKSMDKIPADEHAFLLRGGIVLNKAEQPANPATDFLSPLAWDNITELDRISRFAGLVASLQQATKNWKSWFQSTTPETEPLPGEWEGKCNDLQRMLLVRALRPDRMCITASRFAASNLGPQFVDPPPFDLEAIYESSTFKTPLVFVLSPGVDPTSHVTTLAAKFNKTMKNCALGQGQAPIAESMLNEGLETGDWVFLANCHLMLSWAPKLEKMIDTFSASTTVNESFRLWLTSDPTPKFPMSILQRGIKMTTEPPSGIKANLLRLYGAITPEQFARCNEAIKYKRLLFCLCWFHALLLERRKFNNLGWNIPYEFNESDFLISEDVLGIYLDEYEDTPWDALKYLIAQANYGGRVTDDWDRRLITVYINQFFCPNILESDNAPLSEEDRYYVPPDGELESYMEYIRHLPLDDPPAAFGQHPNAEIASQIDDGKNLLSTILCLQPMDVAEGGQSNDDKVITLIQSLQESIPEQVDMSELKQNLSTRPDPEALKTVLLQELERYNLLLGRIHRSLSDLYKGIHGLVVITPELEAVYNGLLVGSVPKAWSFCYPSLKPLGAWTSDLQLRAGQMRRWALEAMPVVFWLAGFTYPTGFLTALLQTSARKNGVSIDSLNWEFLIINQHEDTITAGPKEGAYVKGLYLEGARWDFDHDCLAEPFPMELHCNMPIIHFCPVESKKKTSRGTYSCPLYIYPIRTGTRERPSFMIAVDLKCGSQKTPEIWTKRGIALLLSLAS